MVEDGSPGCIFFYLYWEIWNPVVMDELEGILIKNEQDIVDDVRMMRELKTWKSIVE